MRTKKTVFYLKIIDPKHIDNKYEIKCHQPYDLPILVTPLNEKDMNRTKITDLSKTKEEHHMHFSFLDESKKDHHCIVTMKNYMTQETIPSSTSVHCFWCRHDFKYYPIGCPIDYIPNRVTKKYYSEITKDEYVLRENMTLQQIQSLQNTNDDEKTNTQSSFDLQTRDYYLMDGIFCSFNCVLAFINYESANNPLYTNSESFIKKIYYDVFGKDALPLIPAPNWRLLSNYGGNLSIEEFRKNFYKVEYNDIDNMIIPFPNSKQVGFLFEKQVKL